MSKLQLHCPASCSVLCDPSDPGISPSCPEGLCTCSFLNSLACFVLFSLCAFCPSSLNPAWLVLLCPSDLVWTPFHTAPKSWPLLFPCHDMPSFLLPGSRRWAQPVVPVPLCPTQGRCSAMLAEWRNDTLRYLSLYSLFSISSSHLSTDVQRGILF